MKVNSLSDAKKGITSGLLAGAAWGINTVLVGVIMASTPFIDSPEAIFLAPFVATFMHDFFAALWTTFYIIVKGEFRNLLKSIKTKNGLVISIGALLGGPAGMTFYLLSVKYIGPAYTAAITAIFPAICALFAAIVLKEKMNRRIWLGIALSILGVFIIGYMPSEFSTGNHFLLGIIFSLLTVIAWSFESIICALGLKDGDMNSDHAITIRQAISGFVYAVMIIPFLNGYQLAFSALNSTVGILIAITALVGALSYIYYYKSIDLIGAARSTSLNNSYVVWAIILQVIFMGTPVGFQLLIGSLIVIIGSLLVVGNPKELIGLNEYQSQESK